MNHPDKHFRSVSGLLLAVVFLLGLLPACAVNPVTGENELNFMSESREIALGNALREQANQQFNAQPADDPELLAYVSAIGQKLAKTSHRPRLTWQFKVVNTSQVNAFAMPGGNIFITRGILLNLHSEDALASILGHEIGHVTARHAAQDYTRSTLTGLAVNIAAAGAAALGGKAVGQLGEAAAGMVGGLVLTSYSRDQERQADLLGYEYMTKNGYNPQGQVDAFMMMKGLEKGEPSVIQLMLSTHPLTSERIADAEKRVADTRAVLRDKPLTVKRYEKMLAKQRERAPAYAAMDQGDAYLQAKQYGMALVKYREAARLFPDEGLFYTKAAMCEVSRKDYYEAEKYGRKAAELSPDLFMAQFLAGYAKVRIGDAEGAVVNLRRAVAILPDHAAANFVLGAACEKNRDRYHAAAYYRRAVRLDPKGDIGRAAYKRLRGL